MKKLNCIFWAKHYDGKTFDVAGVTIYERHKMPIYQEELNDELDAPTFKGLVENVRKKVKTLGGTLKECYLQQMLPGNTHVYLMDHWDDETQIHSIPEIPRG